MPAIPPTDYVSALRPFLNPITPPEDEPFFAALGRFIASYAIAEHQVHLLARHLTRLNDAKARIIFSGMRLNDLAERIRGLLRTTRATEKRYNEVDNCLRQLDLIATQRNNIVHRFVLYTHGQIEVTNIIISKSIDVSERQMFKINDFENMDSDCAAITIRFRIICGGREVPLRNWARSPWRYKSPQPNPKAKQRRSAARQRKHRPPASRG